MPDAYDDLINSVAPAKPRGRTHPNKIAFQPDDADWSLDRLDELGTEFQKEFGRSLPLTNKGQGSVHRKMKLDHRPNADISANPTSREGQWLMSKMRERKMPFLAFTGPVPGASTGAHIHAGRPSHRTPKAAGYQVGSQVRSVKQAAAPSATPDPYDTLIDSVTGDDYDQLIDRVAKESPPAKRSLADVASGGAGGGYAEPPRSSVANVDEILTAARQQPASRPGPGPRSAFAGATGGAGPPDTGMGALRAIDDPETARHLRVEREVAAENLASRRARASGSEAQSLAQRYREHPSVANAEVLKRVSSEKEAEARQRELIATLTPEEKATIRTDVLGYREKGSLERGVGTGGQAVGVGLLYKIAGLTDIVGGNRPEHPNVLGNYLRRKAGQGELTIEEIQADMPPNATEQWADFVSHMVLALPELYAATALGGPVGGFAALGATEAIGRQEGPAVFARETAKGALMGQMFKMASGLESPGAALTKRLGQRAVDIARSGAAIGAGTVAVEKAFGTPDADALRSAATNVAFHTAMRAPELVSRFTAAAERAYVAPEKPTSGARGPTVPEDLQSRLADRDAIRTELDSLKAREEAPKAQTPPVPEPAPVVDAAPATVGSSSAAGATTGVEARRAAPRTSEGDLDWATNLAESRGGSIDRDGSGYIVRMGDEAVSVRTIPEAVATARELDTKLQIAGASRLEEVPEAELEIAALPRRSMAELMAERAAGGPEKLTVTEPVAAPLRTTRKGEAGFINPREITEGLTSGVEKVREKLGDEQLIGKREEFDAADVTYIRNADGTMDLMVFDKNGEYLQELRSRLRGLTTQQLKEVVGSQTALAIESGRFDNDAGTLGNVPAEGVSLPPIPKVPLRELVERTQKERVERTRDVDVIKEIDKNVAEIDRLLKSEVGTPLVHPRTDISGKEIVAVTESGKAVVPNPANKSGVSVVTPRSPEAADRELLSRAGAEYQRHYKALDSHPARREGLSIANDDIAADYFRRLRRFSNQMTPGKTAMVDRAEALYSQGKYADATLLAESVLGGTHDYPNKLNTASIASYMAEKGIEVPISTSKDMWTRTLQEVKKRMGETGPLSGGGSTFYDVTKHPEGGRPDHAKIAYILEPVIEAIRADARRLIAEGKLKTEDFVNHIRREFGTLSRGEEFADWHPLNRGAALGIVVDTLRREGPPVDAPAEAPGGSKPRSLPKTLEKGGREVLGVANTNYTPQPERVTMAKAAERIRRDGPEAAEEWLRTREPESFADEAERTDVFAQLSDAYQTKAVELASSNPEKASELYSRAIRLNNREFDRSTTLGQGIQAYAKLRKYEPAHALLEAKRLSEKAGVPLKPAVAAAVSEAAVKYQREVKEVERLKSRVAVLEGEAPPPTAAGGTGTGTGRGPRATGRPRGENLLPSRLEEARERLTEAQKRKVVAKALVARQLEAIEQSRTVAGYYLRSMNMVRGLMVSQFSTAIRNLQSQAVRYDVERLTDLIEHSMRTSVGLESDFTTRDIWRNTRRQLDLLEKGIKVDKGVYTTSQQKAKDILGEHPLEMARMFNTWMEVGEVPGASNWRTIESPIGRTIERVFQTSEKAVATVNIFNRMQEFHLRSAEFLAEVDLHLKKEHGTSIEQYVKRHGIDAIPEHIVKLGVDKALEVTFSAMPSRDRLGGQLMGNVIQAASYIPPTVSPAPFARFMFNNARFLYQYNPTGLIDTAFTAGRNRGISKQIGAVRADTSLTEAQRTSKVSKLEAQKGNVPRALARTLLGSSMLLLAYQFRKSDHAGEKWYELKFGDYTVDARPFGPFSTYLFFAEAIRRAANGEKAFTVEEIAVAFGSATGPGGTGIAVAEKLYDYAANGQWDKWQRVMKTEGGDFGRAILTPVRQVKDLIAAFDESQAITRDTADQPLLGPIKESIPYASTDLRPAQRPTTAEPIKQEHPVVKQLTGWRVQSPKNYLERQLDELHFTTQEVRPNTGIGELDALEKRLMGPLMDQLGADLEKDEAFKRLGPAQRADIVKEAIQDIREDVRSMGRSERPELYEQLKEERKPQRKKDLEEELEAEQSPGLSSALRLGVPMPIPAKRTNEDDVSYRARLIQLGRARRKALDEVVGNRGFQTASQTEKRFALHQAVAS